MSDVPTQQNFTKHPDPSRSFAAVRRTPVYRAVVEAWREPVMLACSGGADSMGLLVAAAVARAAGRVGPIVVVHVDHRTRPATRQEVQLVREQACRFGLPFAAVSVDDLEDAGTGGLEALLRDLRYRRLARLGAALGIGAVVTAHTRDDQVETVLLRLLAGSSPLAVAGMQRSIELPTADGTLRVLRPLLDTGRQDLLAVLEISETPHAEDPSNLDPKFRRNRIRHELIPLLAEIEPGFAVALLRTIELAKLDAEVVDALALGELGRNARRADSGWVVERAFLRSQPGAIGGRVLKMTIEALVDGDAREVSRERIAAVLDAAGGRTGALIELPYGIRAVIERDVVRIERGEGGQG